MPFKLMVSCSLVTMDIHAADMGGTENDGAIRFLSVVPQHMEQPPGQAHSAPINGSRMW